MKTGTDLVSDTNETFSQVTESASKAGQLLAEIAAASDGQERGIEQVSTAKQPRPDHPAGRGNLPLLNNPPIRHCYLKPAVTFAALLVFLYVKPR